MEENSKREESDTRNTRRKKSLWLLILLSVLFICSPILVRLFISIKMLDEVTNEWIGFYGNYFGTIISVGLSLYILYQNRIDNYEGILQAKKENELKLKHQKKESDDNQKLLLKTNQDIITNSIRPVINAWHVEGIYGQTFKDNKMEYDYVLRDHGKFVVWLNYEKDTDYILEKYFDTELAIESIGVGPIINLEVQLLANGKLFESDEYLTINRDGCIIYRLFIGQHLITNDNKIIFKYRDIYGNKYIQHIEFEARKDDNMWSLTKFKHISIQENDN